MSLYLKYRPKLIEELDLSAVRQTLGEMVKSNNLSHAYLFTGPRGAGKTSSARILARVINCEQNSKTLGEPCNECESCLSILNGSATDVIEIDAASNRGIDDIRELKERIRLAPARLRKKVYIIDEVHMLTTEAFNALLKTLEEPPSHAVFILCTTEAHKVPETIISRCVRVSFTKATPEEMARSFGRVISGEGAKFAKEALLLVARSVDGSFRDGVKTLDTLIQLGREVTVEDVERVMFGSSGSEQRELARSLSNRILTDSLKAYGQAVASGTDLVYLATSVMRQLRDMVIGDGRSELIPLIYQLDETVRKLALSPVPELIMEMTIVEWCSIGKPKNNQTPNPPAQAGSNDQNNGKKSHTSTPPEETNVSEPIGGIDAIEAWNKLTESLSGESYSLGALLSKARPGNIRGNVLTIEMQHSFHREQLMQEKFRAKVEELISRVVGAKMRIECVVTTKPLQTPTQVDTITKVDPEANELLEAAEEIFAA